MRNDPQAFSFLFFLFFLFIPKLLQVMLLLFLELSNLLLQSFPFLFPFHRRILRHIVLFKYAYQVVLRYFRRIICEHFELFPGIIIGTVILPPYQELNFVFASGEPMAFYKIDFVLFCRAFTFLRHCLARGLTSLWLNIFVFIFLLVPFSSFRWHPSLTHSLYNSTKQIIYILSSKPNLIISSEFLISF